jgi:hypothetical protein
VVPRWFRNCMVNREKPVVRKNLPDGEFKASALRCNAHQPVFVMQSTEYRSHDETMVASQ